MDGKSLDIKQDRLQRLKGLFPELFSENQIDWEKLKAAFGNDINFANERYVLNWAGKADAFKILQQPTTATLKPAPEESVNFDTSENLFIEGENLEVLKILQKAYYNKVKCIIIDPPYNTGSDSFIYPDRFSEKKEDYLKRIGDKDEEGFLMKEGLFRKNSKDSGHFHSNWLSMIYPRLFLAKNLLRDDGVIFVHIDDNEVHNLRLIMNEIFGEENFVASFIWKRRQNVDSRSKNGASVDHEYLLCYRKTDKGLIRGAEKDLTKYSNPDNDLRGNWMSADMTGLATPDQRPNLHYDLEDPKTGIVYKCPSTGWRYEPKRMKELIQNNEVIFPSRPDGRPRRKKFQNDLESDFTGFSTILETVFNTQGTRELRALFEEKEYFDFPKPKELLQQILEQGTAGDQHDIILDFFTGSATTAQAVLELNKKDGGNRKFILVQMPEQCDENSEAYKAGYKTIADIGKERIRRVIGKIDKEVIASEAKQSQGNLLETTKIASSQTPRNDNSLDLGFKIFKLSPSNFKIWRSAEIDSEEKLVQQLDAFTNPIKPDAEKQNMLYELMLKAGHELTSSVQHVIASGAKQSQKGNSSAGFYSINNNELIIALDAMNEKLIDQIIATKPQKVITLDSLFTGNDQLKTNTVLQMRDAEVDFKTI
ncbi:MAG: site-specific DNA-methyltransferase [Deltaproteobacteria bacterium]|nr:site-specific DNA-methyltransferase [Deltaproteobacteria bacterium]